MAIAHLKPGAKPIKGIYCGWRYTITSRGEQHMFLIPIPDEEQARKSPEARAKRIIELCVLEIQWRMHSQEEAVKQYRAIKACITRKYSKCYDIIPNNRKLREALVMAYYQDRRRRPSKQRPQDELQIDLQPP